MIASGRRNRNSPISFSSEQPNMQDHVSSRTSTVEAIIAIMLHPAVPCVRGTVHILKGIMVIYLDEYVDISFGCDTQVKNPWYELSRRQLKNRPQYHHIITRTIDTFPNDKPSDPQAYIGYHRLSPFVSLFHKYMSSKCWSVIRRSGNLYAQYQSYLLAGRDTLLPAVLRGNCYL